MRFLLLFIILSFNEISYAQIDITQDVLNLSSSHKIKNRCIVEILDDFIDREDFVLWKKQPKKLIIVTSKKTDYEKFTVKVFPKIREKYIFKHFKNNYKAYIIYKDCLIVFYGDIDTFLEQVNYNLLKLFPEEDSRKSNFDNEIILINNTEIYGAEYFVDYDRIRLNQVDFFSKIE